MAKKKSGLTLGGILTLGGLRESLITLLLLVIVFRIVIWALFPLLPYIVGGIILVTILGVALYRTNKF